MSSQLDQLKAAGTIIVADTGDIEAIRKHRPTDATTNPSLLLKASKLPQYQHLIDDAIGYGKNKPGTAKEQLEWTMDRLAVNFGAEIANIVPGLVSTEVDARLSFKPNRTINKARRLINMYKEKGISSDRILIKIASTWQGIKAAEILEREGIHCNLTLLFNLPAQGVAAAEAGVTLVSPFVGRITDWYKKDTGTKEYAPDDDPGVKSVREIFQYYKKHGYKTTVMGASFRNKEQLVALAGCDKLTIAPKFLKALAECKDPAPRQLVPPSTSVPKPKPLDDRHWYMRMCRDPMATTKLAEGIRGFVRDQVLLEKVVKQRVAANKSKL